MASERELQIRDAMRIPLRRIVDVASTNPDWESDGLAELALHNSIHEYIVERAKFAGVQWRDGAGRPTSSEWCAALLETAAARNAGSKAGRPMMKIEDRARRYLDSINYLADDNDAHGRLVVLLADVRATALEPTEWDDRPTPEDAAISEAFPTRSGRHDLYGEAMRLVGARHSKGALVSLVTWLLLRIERAAQPEGQAGK